MKNNSLRVLFLQPKIDREKPENNRQRIIRLIKKNISLHPQLIMMPEVCLGSPLSKKCQHIYLKEYGFFLDELKKISSQNKITFYGSSYKSRPIRGQQKTEKIKGGGGAFNTAFLISHQAAQRERYYEKIHLFKFHNEHKIYSAGQQIKVWPSPWGKVAPQICYDIRFPELMRQQCFQGARLALVCAQWPRTRQEHWFGILKVRAIENQMFVIACNATGLINKREHSGGSCVFSPWGELLYKMSAAQETGCFDLNLDDIETVRAAFPFLRDARKDRFRFSL